MIKYFFDLILKNPIKILFLTFFSICFLGYNSSKLEIDASAETLLLDNDKDLKYSREINKRYYNPELLIITYEPNENLLSKSSLSKLKKLSTDLTKLEKIESITSILNVPLLQSPTQELNKLVDNIKTLENKNIDKDLVKTEFLESEIYKNNLVSKDFKTTAIILNLKQDNKYIEFLEKRNFLLIKKRSNTISNKEEIQLKSINIEFKKHRNKQRILNHNTIEDIRKIINKYKNNNTKLFLGGVGMISDDIVGFVKNDLLIYGSTLIVLLILILWIIFRQIIWIILPIVICAVSVISTTGALGLFSWEVTVISSNFISLQLIITISIVLHLIVRYRELSKKYHKSSQYKLLINTILSKLNPSFFAIVTTIAGFGSLVLSEIQPVKNLGLMMSTGIAISLFLAFIIFPTILIMMKKIPNINTSKLKFNIISMSQNIVKNNGSSIIIISIIILAISIVGASKLIVENSFINYFKTNTEIYKGMKVIDENLGGTTPLDIILKFNTNSLEDNSIEDEDEDDFDSFTDEYEDNSKDEQYWFTEDKMDVVIKVHNYLESLPEIGKVQSLATLLKVGKVLNKGEDLDGFMLALLYNKLPIEYKKIVLDPYVNIEHNEIRINTRIVDSNPNLRRNELINKINYDLKNIIKDDSIEYKLSNLMILYNNMLQSLFNSQILTLGFVVLILFIMFLILFRSFTIAFIAILANIVPISIIFGIMGFLSIPLDIMTITIAAISIGIGVDDTIHYIHRFYEEYKKDHNYLNAMQRSHDSIGYAMTYTSLVVIVGFSILVLSNLIPTIYFGLLTVIVMITILASALLLLPKLLIMLKPYKIKKHYNV
ncbi:MAG: MMPL family transporter [Arcobacter sp.]|nr:MMPL family transporter [Arcobacter sp.]